MTVSSRNCETSLELSARTARQPVQKIFIVSSNLQEKIQLFLREADTNIISNDFYLENSFTEENKKDLDTFYTSKSYLSNMSRWPRNFSNCCGHGTSLSFLHITCIKVLPSKKKKWLMVECTENMANRTLNVI